MVYFLFFSKFDPLLSHRYWQRYFLTRINCLCTRHEPGIFRAITWFARERVVAANYLLCIPFLVLFRDFFCFSTTKFCFEELGDSLRNSSSEAREKSTSLSITDRSVWRPAPRPFIVRPAAAERPGFKISLCECTKKNALRHEKKEKKQKKRQWKGERKEIQRGK